MADLEGFAGAFAAAHPEVVAHTLEDLGVEQAAAALKALPAKLAASVSEAMLPRFAARCLEKLEKKQAADVMKAISVAGASGILRHIDDDARGAYLEAMPAGRRTRALIALRYPRATVGALMSHRVYVLSPTMTIAKTLERMRRDQVTGIGEVYVQGTGETPVGVITLDRLLSAPETVTLGKLVEPLEHFLTASHSLHAARDHEGWATADRLVVVDRDRKILGAVSYLDLMRGVSERAAEKSISGTAEGLLDLSNALYLGLANVLTLALAPPRSRADADEDR